MKPLDRKLGAVALTLLLASCDDSLFTTGQHPGGTGGGSGWCAVRATFDASCVSCHSPSGGVQGDLDLETDPLAALVGVPSTYAGRTLVVPGDPAASFLLVKLQGTEAGGEGSTMPLGGSLSASAIDAVSSWIADGATSDCGSTGTLDTGPLPVCNTDHEECGPGKCGGEGPTMLPGADCLACHSRGSGTEAPPWTAAGTAFTDRWGTDPLVGATVHLVGADGGTIDLKTNAVGNFYTNKPLATPFTASIETPAGTLSMSAEQTDGGCSSCHRCDGPPGGKLFGQ